MEFGKRDVRKSAGIQSRQVRPPGNGPPEDTPRENVSEKARSTPSGLILPVIAGGILVVLIAIWIVGNVNGSGG